MSLSSRTDSLELIERVMDCEACPLHVQGKGGIPWSGAKGATIAIVGGAPDAEADEEYKPIAGAAKALVLEALKEAGIDVGQVAFLNTVACLSHGLPAPEHIDACSPLKAAQLDHLGPSYVLLLGEVALQGFELAARARPFVRDGRVYWGTYNPAMAFQPDADKAAACRAGFMRDVVVFGELMRAERWTDYIPDSCVSCSEDAIWWGVDMLGWCEAHLPKMERKRRQVRVDYCVGHHAAVAQAGEERLDGGVWPRCPYCGRAMVDRGQTVARVTRDHIVPKSRLKAAGITLHGNILNCCRSCNTDKDSLTPAEWLARLKSTELVDFPSGKKTLKARRIACLEALSSTLAYFDWQLEGGWKPPPQDELSDGEKGAWTEDLLNERHPQWADRAWRVLVEYLQTHDEFFVDDFWANTSLDRPADSRALGPLVNRAAREGLIEKTGEFRKSVASNMTEKPCWRSKVCAR